MVQTSLAVAALTCGTGAAAFAQTVPAEPAPVTAPVAADATAPEAAQPAAAQPAAAQPVAADTTPVQTAPSTVAQGPATPPRKAPPPPPAWYLPVLDFVGTYTWPAYYGSQSNLAQYDAADLGGSARFNITRKFALVFDRITEGTLNVPLDCIRVPARSCPNDSRDVLLQYHGIYQFTRWFNADAGTSFRHRIYASGGGGVSRTPFLCVNNGQSTGPACSQSSTEHHFAYLSFNYTTHPIKELLRSTFIFSITGEAQNVDHHVGTTAKCTTQPPPPQAITCGGGAINYLDENTGQNRYFETTQGVSLIVPVDARRGVALLLNERWGALNFYENAAGGYPYRWNSALIYQLSKRFNQTFTLAVRHTDYHAIQGHAVPFPNSVHVGSWDLLGTFHVDTNTLFH